MSRPKIGFRTASKEAYAKFCNENPTVTLSFEDYKKILYTFNENLMNHLLETGDKTKFPYGLGELVISKYKPIKYVKGKDGKERINLSVDWVETKKAGKYVYLLNTHTEGYKYCWMWRWWQSRLKYAFIWKFSVSRSHSRKLSAYLKKANSPYRDIYKEYPRTK